MVESALLAIGGAVAGLLVAGAIGRFLIGFLGDGLFLELRFDARLLVFVISVASLTCMAFGLIPAWRVARGGVGDAMKAGGRSFSASRSGSALRQALVVSQIALSLVLLFGALLFSRTLQNLQAVDPGFQHKGIVIARVDLSRLDLAPANRVALKHSLLEHIRAVTGVSAAAEVRHVPMGGTGTRENIRPDGADADSGTSVRFNAVSEGYFETMEMTLLAGRGFTGGDTGSSPNVAVVNQTFAWRFGMGANPVGKTFWRESNPAKPPVPVEIVGLVEDTKYFSLREDFIPIVFVPVSQNVDPRAYTDFMIRSSATQLDVSSTIRHAVNTVSPHITLDMRIFDTVISDGLRREHLMAALSTFLSILAGLIAAVGLHGVMSYQVVQRTNEIGIRMALGATRSNILTMVMKQAGALLGIGLGLGSLLAFAAAGTARTLLFGLEPHDPLMIGLACGLLALVSVAACYTPARRAATLNPVAALRKE
jgi:predicted permease